MNCRTSDRDLCIVARKAEWCDADDFSRWWVWVVEGVLDEGRRSFVVVRVVDAVEGRESGVCRWEDDEGGWR